VVVKQGSLVVCPFCHSEPPQTETMSNKDYRIVCSHCHAAGPLASSKTQAMQAWLQATQDKNLLELVFNESPAIMMVKDFDGHFVIGNKTLANHYNTTPQALVGKTDADFNNNQTELEFYISNLRKVIRSGKSQVVEEASTDQETGQTRHFLSIKKPFVNAAGEPQVLILAHDITELKQAYLQLEEREKRFEYAMAAAGEGIWDWDIENNLVTHNTRWCDIFGLGTELSKHPIDIFEQLLHPDDQASVFEALQNVKNSPDNGDFYQHEHRMIRADGQAIWVHDRGNVVERNAQGEATRIVGAVSDITLRKSAELQLKKTQQQLHQHNETLAYKVKQQTEALLKSEERFSLAMRNSANGLWDWDLETDEVFYSPRWKEQLGYKEHELDNSIDTWKNIVHPDDKEHILAMVEAHLEGSTVEFEAEMRLKHKNGHTVYIRTRAFKISQSDSQRATRLIGTNVDITAQKEAQKHEAHKNRIIKMIAKGTHASKIYDEIATLYESRHPNLLVTLIELRDNKLYIAGAPSMPAHYQQKINGLKNGPTVGSCGVATYTGERVISNNIQQDENWSGLQTLVCEEMGFHSCWSDPIKTASGKVLGAFAMYSKRPREPSLTELADMESASQLASIIMEREASQRHVRNLAYTDSLTQISSRAHFYLRLQELTQNANRHSDDFSLLYVDLDNFKAINDSLGHDAGDKLLKITAQRLQQTCRDSDLIARIGGDEFCMLVFHTANENTAARVAERVLELIAQPANLTGRRIIPSCSVGIANFPSHGDSLDTLIKSADTALYEAKKLGKNRYAFYDEALTRDAAYQFTVENALHQAIEDNELTLVYQPQLHIKSNKIVGVEALCRWNHARLGDISPSEFIGIAERTGMIKPLTEWVLKKACSQAALWRAQGGPAIRIAVNISPSHFLDRDLVPLIQRTLNDTGLAPNELELEVTEGVIQTNPQNLAVFENLKALGINIAIDDFGSGYSSFASLKHLDIDFLKIDKHFIDDLLTDPKSHQLVSSMITMGHNLGYTVIAEGIESTAQLALLRTLECDIAQGFKLSTPLEADTIESLFLTP